MNNLTISEALKASAKRQSKEIKDFAIETNQKNWNKLSKDLTSIMNKKLDTIEEDINSKMIDILKQYTLKEGEKKRYIRIICTLSISLLASLSAIIILVYSGTIDSSYININQDRNLKSIISEEFVPMTDKISLIEDKVVEEGISIIELMEEKRAEEALGIKRESERIFIVKDIASYPSSFH